MDNFTYLQAGLRNNKLIRWIDNCFPLKFYIAPFRWYKAKSENDAYKYNSLVKRALEEWSRVTKNKVCFQIVNTLNESQINLDWKRIDRKALGQCYFNFDNNSRLYSAEVQIGLSDGIIHSKYMDEAEVYHTILHEIGHALGLGHSPNNQDIMYTPHQYGVTSLSRGDIETINWLYRLPFGLTPEEFAQSYKISSKNIDDIIYLITKNNTQSEFAKTQKNLKLQTPTRNLLDEQTRIAEIKKYNIALQNIQISTDFQKFLQQNKNN